LKVFLLIYDIKVYSYNGRGVFRRSRRSKNPNILLLAEPWSARKISHCTMYFSADLKPCRFHPWFKKDITSTSPDFVVRKYFDFSKVAILKFCPAVAILSLPHLPNLFFKVYFFAFLHVTL